MKHSVAINLSNSELSTPPSPFFSHTANPNKMLPFLMPGTCIYEIQTQIHYLKSKINEMYKRGEKIFIVHCPSIKPVSFAFSPCIIHFPPKHWRLAKCNNSAWFSHLRELIWSARGKKCFKVDFNITFKLHPCLSNFFLCLIPPKFYPSLFISWFKWGGRNRFLSAEPYMYICFIHRCNFDTVM